MQFSLELHWHYMSLQQKLLLLSVLFDSALLPRWLVMTLSRNLHQAFCPQVHLALVWRACHPPFPLSIHFVKQYFPSQKMCIFSLHRRSRVVGMGMLPRKILLSSVFTQASCELQTLPLFVWVWWYPVYSQWTNQIQATTSIIEFTFCSCSKFNSFGYRWFRSCIISHSQKIHTFCYWFNAGKNLQPSGRFILDVVEFAARICGQAATTTDVRPFWTS